MGLSPVDFFLKARFEPLTLAVLLAGVAWYAWSLARLRGKGSPWPVARTVCFGAGVAAVAVAASSGLTSFAASNFSAFAAQYILAGLVAPLLLAFAAPIDLAVRSSSAPDRGRLLERRPVRVATHPITTWLSFTATLFVVFFTGVLTTAVTGGWAAQAVYLWLLAAGLVFWWPVVDADPLPRRVGYWPRILYLLLTFPVFAIVGMTLESRTGGMAPAISAASLHLGAAVIWLAGEAMALGGVVAVFAQWLRADERRAKAQDRANEAAAARQLALWRASREAAARAASSR